MLTVDRDQVLAFRVAAHNLHERTDPLTAVAACGIQDSPPGWAAVALHARAVGEPDPDQVVTVNAMRGAPYVVPRRDQQVFTTALVPQDERGLRALVGGRVPKELDEHGWTTTAALTYVSDAARDALSRGPLGRDDFHQALRERLQPHADALLPWCRGCQSHHVRPGLWRALGPLGVTEMPARATWALADPEPAQDRPAAAAELARRFMRCYGPASHTQLAAWAQTAPAHAKTLVQSVGEELEPVSVEGRKRLALAADLARLETPPRARGVRMLGGFDPWLDQRDREIPFPDPVTRKQVFPAVGRPGIVLADGRIEALWRSRKQAAVLSIEVTWLGVPVDLGEEPQDIARLRGCERAIIR